MNHEEINKCMDAEARPEKKKKKKKKQIDI